MKKIIFASLLGALSTITSCGRTTDTDATQGNTAVADSGATAQPITITSEKQFSDALKSDGLVLVDFYATWCAPCKAMHPVLEKVARDMAADVTVIKVDVDRNEQLAGMFKIQSIPTLLLFKKGDVVWSNIGMTRYNDLKNIIDQKKN